MVKPLSKGSDGHHSDSMPIVCQWCFDLSPHCMSKWSGWSTVDASSYRMARPLYVVGDERLLDSIASICCYRDITFGATRSACVT